MGRFIEGCDRREQLFLPTCVDDYVAEDSTVRIVDVFVDELDLVTLGFAGAAATGRPGYHPATLLKLYVYGYLNQVQSSRRLEREAGRNVELMWLTGKLAPDIKTIADFRLRWRRVMRRGRFIGDWIIGVLREYEAGVKSPSCAGSTGLVMRRSTTGRRNTAG